MSSQTRLQELTDNDHPTGLEMELGVLRFLQDEALNNNEPRFAVEICKAIGQLSHAAETAKIRRGELLAKSVVLGIARSPTCSPTMSPAGSTAGRIASTESSRRC